MNASFIAHRSAVKIRLVVVALVLLLAAPLLVSCNTTAGFGRDLTKVGDAIEDTARR